MPLRISVLGDGAWGTTVAILLASKPDRDVTLWSARPENGRRLRELRENRAYLPGVPIPPAVHLTYDRPFSLADADLVVCAVPTVYLRRTLEEGFSLAPTVPVLSLSKGLEIDTFQRPTEIIGSLLGSTRLAVLSGPSHAEEVSRDLPASLVVASEEMDLARWIQQVLSTERFRVYTNSDMVGVETAGTLKNILGIAAGICDGLALGDNAKAALLTRGLVEMAHFGVAAGGTFQTYFGLAGLGDVITTCFSKFGRNRLVGERLGRGEKTAAIMASMTMVAEGVYTTRSVYDNSRQLGLTMPITVEVFRVLYEDKDPRQAVRDLMERELTSERAAAQA